MKSLLLLSLIVSIVAPIVEASERTEVELKIEQVFIPNKGFDDNDAIEAVTTGSLPNPCYSIGRSYAERTTEGYRIHQLAWLSKDGPCATGDLINDPVPFLTTVPIGRLGVGKYNLQFENEKGEVASKQFAVSLASSRFIDNFSYAAVRSASVDMHHAEGRPFTVQIKGTIPFYCPGKVLPAEVDVVDDVILIFPLVGKADDDCSKKTHSFTQNVTIPPQKAGNYLVHIRSRGGNAVYQHVRIWKVR